MISKYKMSAPAPTSQLLKYADEVDVNVAPQQVNLVDLESYGHRVSISVATSSMNGALSWSRAAGSARPVGHFSDASGALVASLAFAMNTLYTDTDAVTDKLSFDSSALSLNSDARIRQGGQVSANDLMMAYVLYKVYGSTTAPTEEIIFNLQDAHGMLTSADYAAAIVAAFNNSESQASASGNEKGAVDAMFRDLLAADPLRFFNASGAQVPGLFEVNTDASTSGTWNLVDGDKIEVRTVFTFLNSVTLRTSSDVAQNLNPLPNQANDETVYIAAGSKLSIRLQITASDSAAIVGPNIVAGVLIGYNGDVPTNVTLGANVNAIDPTVFKESTALQSIDLSATSMTFIDENSFYNCTSLSSVILPEGLLEIRGLGFTSTPSLTSIIIPNSVTYIGEYVFASCTELSSITLPTGLQEIGAGAFNYCGTLTSITLPAGLTGLPPNLFTECTALISVRIPFSFDLATWTGILGAAGYTGAIVQA